MFTVRTLTTTSLRRTTVTKARRPITACVLTLVKDHRTFRADLLNDSDDDQVRHVDVQSEVDSRE